MGNRLRGLFRQLQMGIAISTRIVHAATVIAFAVFSSWLALLHLLVSEHSHSREVTLENCFTL